MTSGEKGAERTGAFFPGHLALTCMTKAPGDIFTRVAQIKDSDPGMLGEGGSGYIGSSWSNVCNGERDCRKMQGGRGGYGRGLFGQGTEGVETQEELGRRLRARRYTCSKKEIHYFVEPTKGSHK